MSEKLLFNSLREPVPPVRKELEWQPVPHNGETFLLVHDPLGYVPPSFALNEAVEPVLSLLNGQMGGRSIADIISGEISSDELLGFIRILDKNCILHSRFQKEAANRIESSFEAARVRPPALADLCYPSDPVELEKYLEGLFAAAPPPANPLKPKKALYAPHIDPAVGGPIYASAFSILRNLAPKRVVILATAHYSGYYALYNHSPFIGSRKVFELPHGHFPVDAGFMDRLAETGEQAGYTEQDRAHRIEHSIELHLLFLRHIWKHDFSIVPLLVSSFDELFYMPEGHLHQQIDNFTSLLQELDDEETFYLISGDLSHVGRKFGDHVAASDMRRKVEEFDRLFLDAACQNDRDRLFSLIRSEYDPYRICGFPPLFTFMNLFGGLKGRTIAYHWWDESERESAVSFGAIAY